MGNKVYPLNTNKIEARCFCCKRHKSGTYIKEDSDDVRFVCNDCNNLKPKKSKNDKM